ncbi:MAG TPA: hypothetical protein VKK61_04630, partial [Tepidisphaeraceae bacterium]|nr:hypothetical protein [Tepidisphaeraceae bacterium]
MYKFFRKYQKHTMAFFMVVLMVAFIVPTTFRNGQGSSDQIVGHVGSEKVYLNNIRQAEDEWSILTTVMHRTRMTGEEQWEPILLSMPQQLLQDIKNKPEKYYLLQLEAKKMGLSPNAKNAEDTLTNPNIGIRMPDGSVISYDNIDVETARNNLRISVANFLMITEAFHSAASAIKISAPLAQHELAAEAQRIKTRVVDFTGKDYEDKVP